LRRCGSDGGGVLLDGGWNPGVGGREAIKESYSRYNKWTWDGI
jgi:hypothetical protein